MSYDDGFATVTDQGPAEYINLEESVGKLLIVIPREYQKEGFITEFQPNGTDVVFCDIASLDLLDEESGKPGKIYRRQSILQGYLKGTFKRYLGQKMIGMLYFGPKEKGRKPPYKWQDLSGEEQIRTRGLQWLAANPQFLVDAEFTAAAPASEPVVQQGPPRYVAPVQPQRAASTLDQLRQMGQVNAQGQPQSTDAPF